MGWQRWDLAMLVFAVSVSTMLCQCKNLMRGDSDNFETSHSLTLPYPHRITRMHEPGQHSGTKLLASGVLSGMLCEDMKDKGCQRLRRPRVACLLLRLVALLLILEVPFCTLWELAVSSLPILHHLCYPNKSLGFIPFSLSPNLGWETCWVARSCTGILVTC